MVELAKMYNVKKCVIHGIIKNKTYFDNDYIPYKKGSRGSKCARTNLTEKDIIEIRERYKKEKRYGFRKLLAEEYNISMDCLWAILSYKTWTHI